MLTGRTYLVSKAAAGGWTFGLCESSKCSTEDAETDGRLPAVASAWFQLQTVLGRRMLPLARLPPKYLTCM